jgi:8-oxo-dGTP pyrophosphatase MutT (NUDIX family)
MRDRDERHRSKMTAVISPGGEVSATPAATVVPLRDGEHGLEVLLLRRNTRGSFAGMWVFPGGRVEPADAERAASSGPVVGDRAAMAAISGGSSVPAVGLERPSELATARCAAVREALEEAAVRLAPEQLAVLSWWLPPREAARRFSTWFFLAPFAVGEAVTVDRGEISEHRWLQPASALAARDRGEIELAPPTWMTLRALAAFPDVDGAMSAARARPPSQYVTRVLLSGSSLLATLWEGDVAYDDPTVGLGAPGPRRRLVFDDAGWRFEGQDFDR